MVDTRARHLMVSALLSFGLVACGGGDGPSGTNPGSNVGISVPEGAGTESGGTVGQASGSGSAYDLPDYYRMGFVSSGGNLFVLDPIDRTRLRIADSGVSQGIGGRSSWLGAIEWTDAQSGIPRSVTLRHVYYIKGTTLYRLNLKKDAGTLSLPEPLPSATGVCGLLQANNRVVDSPQTAIVAVQLAGSTGNCGAGISKVLGFFDASSNRMVRTSHVADRYTLHASTLGYEGENGLGGWLLQSSGATSFVRLDPYGGDVVPAPQWTQASRIYRVNNGYYLYQVAGELRYMPDATGLVEGTPRYTPPGAIQLNFAGKSPSGDLFIEAPMVNVQRVYRLSADGSGTATDFFSVLRSSASPATVALAGFGHQQAWLVESVPHPAPARLWRVPMTGGAPQLMETSTDALDRTYSVAAASKARTVVFRSGSSNDGSGTLLSYDADQRLTWQQTSAKLVTVGMVNSDIGLWGSSSSVVYTIPNQGGGLQVRAHRLDAVGTDTLLATVSESSVWAVNPIGSIALLATGSSVNPTYFTVDLLGQKGSVIVTSTAP